MKIILFTITISFFLFACNDKKEEKNVTTNQIELADSLPVSINGCYAMIISEDTALMKIDQNNNVITGTLSYKRKEKDSNKGNVILIRSGNRAEGFYNFQSEGQNSVRQIVFKINNNSLAEGYGDIGMRNDTALFKYPHALNFEEKHAFNKIKCQ